MVGTESQEDLIRRYLEAKDYHKAIDLCQTFLRERPNDYELLFLLGVSYQKAGQLAVAEAIYRELLKIRKTAGIFFNLGLISNELGSKEKAVIYYDKALELNPQYFDARFNLILILQSLNEFWLARYHLHQLLSYYPNSEKAMHSYAINCDYLGLLEEATTYFKRVLACDDSKPEYHTNYGIELLAHGNFKEGWKEYHWRNLLQGRKRDFPFPEWQGEPIAGKQLFVCAEQGAGDVLQFLRYLPLIKPLGAKIVLECHESLYSLCKIQSFADRVIIMGGASPKSSESGAAVLSATVVPFCDYYVHLLSLPEILKTNLSNIPHDVPYISVAEHKLTAWREKLKHLKQFRVGIVWAGTPLHTRDAYRSCSLSSFLPFLRLPGIDYVSLQKKFHLEELETLPKDVKVMDLDQEIEDYLDTAACISQLDLVITVDTSVAHLAGALAKPVWVLLASPADWRWLLHREDSPWYPTMRLFRQQEQREWGPVIERITNALKEKV